jgi:hypothetical protein
MIVMAMLGLKVVGDIPEALSTGQLANQHCHELTPPIVRPEFLP